MCDKPKLFEILATRFQCRTRICWEMLDGTVDYWKVAWIVTSLCPSDRGRIWRLAKQDFHDEQLKNGLAALAVAGIAVEAPSVASIPALREVWRRSPEMDLAAVFLLGKIATAEAAEQLREFDRGSADKELKKEIKRSLFKLSQKGVVVPPEPAAEKKLGPLFERENQIEALYVRRRWRRRTADLDRQAPDQPRLAGDPSHGA